MYFTTAKFNSRCTETGARITKGDNILYDRENKKVYGFTSQRFKTYTEGQDTNDDAAHEAEFFDNWARRNI